MIKVGFLPLYLKLYDDVLDSMRDRIDQFNMHIQERLSSDFELVAAPICRIEDEFTQTVDLFDEVCAVFTLHLAYSPSLECIESLVKMKKPIIVLDTTPSFSFDERSDSEELLYNHGIHGVQDMCNMLKRRGVDYWVVAGHWQNSDVLNRCAELGKAAYAAHVMKNSKVGLIGSSFEGMGDFFITPDELKKIIGAEVVPFDMDAVEEYKHQITDEDIQMEMKADLDIYNISKYDVETHKRTARMDLLVRNWVCQNKLDAYSMNFTDINRETGFECVPFIEACKSMASGIGYAGEGDVLTAVLCGALLKIYPETSFTEMFCPDWKGNSIFLSHMGEMNEKTSKGKMNLTVKEYPYSDIEAPLMVNGTFMPGIAVLVNLAPMDDRQYILILSKISVLDVNEKNGMSDGINGWFRPDGDISDFLEKYSMAGGTHHLVIVYGDVISSLMAFGRMMGFSVKVI